MSYQRDNIYRAKCDENNPNVHCIKLGPIAESIQKCFLNACEDGWKMLSERNIICPACLKYLQDMKKGKMLNA